MGATPQEVWEFLLKLGEEIRTLHQTVEKITKTFERNGIEIEELKKLSKETDRQLKETDRQLKETDRQLKETERQLKETDKKLEKYFKETDRQLKETDKKLEKYFKETDKKIKELTNLFTTQWGRLIEALVEPGVLELFQKWGIKVKYTSRRIEIEDEMRRRIMEIDLFLENDVEGVIVEVKNFVKKEDVDELLEKLDRFKEVRPKYREYRLYGAIAGINFAKGVDKYAYRKGLFVLKSKGGLIEIANDEKFKPRVW